MHCINFTSEYNYLQVNSYQATIVSDVTQTYAIFSYMCGGVQWSSLGRNRAAAVGYNSEGDYFVNHPLSGIAGVGDAVSCTFDIGRRRKRQNGMGNNVGMPIETDQDVVAAVDECLGANNRDGFAYILNPELTPEILAKMLDPCPCTLQQAIVDSARFRRFDGPGNCYISSRPVSEPEPVLLFTLGVISLTQKCCYMNG